MSLDQLIEQKKDAYRGNPAALERRSKVSKQLTDVLALEQLTQEVDARSRAMLMQVENQPGTIAEQLQQKAIGQKQAEMAQGVAGVLANNQARQKQNIQRVASQGVAAQPRPNMQTMAQGGIVGFTNGGQATFDKIEAIRARTDIDEKTKYQMIQAALGREGYKDPTTLDRAAANIQSARATRDAAQDKVGLPMDFDELESGAAGQQLGATDITDRPAQEQTTTTTGDGTTAPEEETGPALDPKLGQVAMPDARTQFLSEPKGVKLTDATTFAQTQKGIQGLLDTDPDQVRKDRLALGQAEIGMTPDRLAKEQARQKALADLDARQLDPKKLEQDRLRAYLRGAATSGTFTGGSANVAALEAQQQLAERNRLLGRQLGERTFEDEQQRIKERISADADTAYDVAAQNLRQGVSSSAALTDTETKMLSDNARDLLSRDIANMEAEDRASRLRTETAIANASQGVKVGVANLEAETARERRELEETLKRLEIGELSMSRAETELGRVLNYMGKIRTDLQRIYSDRIDNINVGGEEAEAATAELQGELAIQTEIFLGDLRERAKKLEAKLAAGGSGASGGFTVRQK